MYLKWQLRMSNKEKRNKISLVLLPVLVWPGTECNNTDLRPFALDWLADFLPVASFAWREAHLQWPAWIGMCYYTTSCHLLCSQYSVLVDLIMQYSTFSPFPLLNIFILLHNLVQHDTRVFYSHCHCLIFSCWIVFKLWVTPVLTDYSSFKNNQYSAHAWGKMCCCVTWNVLHSGLNQTAWRTSVFWLKRC